MGPATGAIAVIKTPDSPNYIISYEGDSLISRQIGSVQGDFLPGGSLPLTFSPKAIVFDETSQTLIVIPSDPNVDLVKIPLDTL